MKPMHGMVICLGFLLLAFPQRQAQGDWIKFKHGAKKQCVIREDDQNFVSFLTSYGEMKMPKSRIESIEREAEDVNASLEEQWTQKPKRRENQEEEETTQTTVAQKPKTLKTYRIEIKQRRRMLGARASGLTSEVLHAAFTIDDKGTVEGNHLFSVSVTSYKSTPSEISAADFTAVLEIGMKIKPHTIKDQADLKARLFENQSASGSVAFPTSAKLAKLLYKSELADFELDLETGEFVVNKGPF
jgi:hypothetical protein